VFLIGHVPDTTQSLRFFGQRVSTNNTLLLADVASILEFAEPPPEKIEVFT